MHVLDASHRLGHETVSAIRTIAESALSSTAPKLNLEPVDVVVCRYPGLADDETGVGGYCPGPNLVFVAVEPEKLADDWQQIVFSTAVHELHHAARWQGPGYGERLIDSLVSEGLATTYETQRTGITPRHARDTRDVEELWKLAQPVLADTGAHSRWFFGTSDIRRWAGYALGTELVARYLALHKTTAVDAAQTPADDFPRAW